MITFEKSFCKRIKPGRITLRDKSEIIGFIGRGADKISGEDITKFGGWRYAG